MTPDQSHWPLILPNENREQTRQYKRRVYFFMSNYCANVIFGRETYFNRG